MKRMVWNFDMLIYRLFYWRWRKKLENRSDIRKLFLRYLNNWEGDYDKIGSKQKNCDTIGL